jgi:hypothetical protein
VIASAGHQGFGRHNNILLFFSYVFRSGGIVYRTHLRAPVPWRMTAASIPISVAFALHAAVRAVCAALPLPAADLLPRARRASRVSTTTTVLYLLHARYVHLGINAVIYSCCNCTRGFLMVFLTTLVCASYHRMNVLNMLLRE